MLWTAGSCLISKICWQWTKYKKHKEEIIQAVLKAKSKQQVNNNLMKIYNAGNIVREIYKKLKPLIKDLPGK